MIVTVNVIRRNNKMSSYINVPEWYITPDEFAKLVTDCLYDSRTFSRDEKLHPEDIEIAFSSVASTIASSITYIGKKLEEKKKIPTYQYTTTKIKTNFIDSTDKNITYNKNPY